MRGQAAPADKERLYADRLRFEAAGKELEMLVQFVLRESGGGRPEDKRLFQGAESVNVVSHDVERGSAVGQGTLGILDFRRAVYRDDHCVDVFGNPFCPGLGEDGIGTDLGLEAEAMLLAFFSGVLDRAGQ